MRPWVCPSFRWATIDLPPCVSPARARELGMERRHQQALMRGSSEGPRISTAGAWTLMGHACDFGGGSRSRPLSVATGHLLATPEKENETDEDDDDDDSEKAFEVDDDNLACRGGGASTAFAPANAVRR